MPNSTEIYSKLGTGFCIVKEGKILEIYLLDNSEIQKIEKLTKITMTLPEDFEAGVLELDIKNRFGVIKMEDKFVLFPAKSDNVGEILRKKGVLYEA
ncbi:MAG: hypothetical protein NZ872_02690 [Archaeoglobaceae archaeon]|nr:hypothetical protein [Archaeoglobaceae archaeon]MDW8128105.1 hypothetical protein [Archaeoglobaceae archaeon]